MFRTHLDEHTRPSMLGKWWWLGFIGGQINAGGFLATGRFVSHVTGFATLFGVELVRNEWWSALGILLVPAFFLLGTLISGYFIEIPISHEARPRFDWVMALVTFCLLICAIGGKLHWFGAFGQETHFQDDYLIMALLCLASGLQNAAICASSGGQVRVTHLTGITTDLGLGWVRWWALRKQGKHSQTEWVKNKFRVGMIAAFAAGSAVGTYFFLKFQLLGFLFPMVCSIFCWWEARRAIRTKSDYIF